MMKMEFRAGTILSKENEKTDVVGHLQDEARLLSYCIEGVSHGVQSA